MNYSIYMSARRDNTPINYKIISLLCQMVSQIKKIKRTVDVIDRRQRNQTKSELVDQSQVCTYQNDFVLPSETKPTFKREEFEIDNVYISNLKSDTELKGDGEGT